MANQVMRITLKAYDHQLPTSSRSASPAISTRVAQSSTPTCRRPRCVNLREYSFPPPSDSGQLIADSGQRMAAIGSTRMPELSNTISKEVLP